MLIKLHEAEIVEAIECLKKGQLGFRLAPCCGGFSKIFYENPGVDLLLYVDRWSVYFKVSLIQFVFASPDELRIKRRISLIAKLLRLLHFGPNELLGVGGGEICPFVFVSNGLDR